MLNSVHVIGHLGKDPVIETTSKGTTYAFLSLANNRGWKDRDGQRQEKTTWVDVVAFGNLAQAFDHLSKGDLIAVDGRLNNKTKDGKVSGLELLAESVDFLKTKKQKSAAPQGADADAAGLEDGEDIPF